MGVRASIWRTVSIPKISQLPIRTHRFALRCGCVLSAGFAKDFFVSFRGCPSGAIFRFTVATSEPKKFNQSCVYVWPTSVLMLTVAVGSLCCFWLAGQHPPGPPLPLRLFCLQLWISFLKLDNRKVQYKYYSQVILENQVLTARQDTTWRPETEYLMKRPKLPILFFFGGSLLYS